MKIKQKFFLTGVLLTNFATGAFKVGAVEQPPAAIILSPQSQDLYRGGELITLKGTASDPDTPVFLNSNFAWELFYFDQEKETYLPTNINIVSGKESVVRLPTTGPIFEQPTFLRLQLRVTDTGGLFDEYAVQLAPQTSKLTLLTEPSGFDFDLDETIVDSPFEKIFVVGVSHTLRPLTPQELQSKQYVFARWKDGGSLERKFAQAATDQSLTAIFREKTYQLTVNGGSGTGAYFESQVIPITPTTEPGDEFLNWEGPVANADNPSTTVTITRHDLVVTAKFKKIPYTLSVKDGVILDPHSDGNYYRGDQIQIRANEHPDPDPNAVPSPTPKIFAMWVGAEVEDKYSPQTRFTMPAISTVLQAMYREVGTFLLRVIDGIEGEGFYIPLRMVPIKAAPDLNGMVFYKWEGEGIENVASLQTRVRMRWRNTTVQALYLPAGAIPPDPVNGFGEFKTIFTPPQDDIDITYGVQGTQSVEIKIVDIQGRLVRMLLNTSQSGSPLTVNWDGRNDEGNLVTSDAYVAILNIGDHVETKKVVVIR